MGRPGDVLRAIRLSTWGMEKRFVRPQDDPCDPGSSEPRLKRKERKRGPALVIHSMTPKDMARYVKMHDTQLRQVLKESPGLYAQVKKMQLELSRPDLEQSAMDAAIEAHDREARA